MVAISKNYQRYQMRNIPPISWQQSHTQDSLDKYMDPRVQYILDGLPYDTILRLVVGSRWTDLHPSTWPRRIRERTRLLTGEALDIRDNELIDVGLSKVREWWEKTGRFLPPIPVLRAKRAGLF